MRLLGLSDDLGQRSGVGVEVDEAALPAQPVVPAGLQVGYLHGVADALDVAGRLATLGAEDGRHATPQEVAHCTQRV
jgi:hypothetical protein